MAKKIKKEHSVNEVYEVLVDFVGFTKNQFEKAERQFEKQGQILALHTLQLENVTTDIRDLKTGQNNMEKDIKMIKEDIVAVGKSIYKQHKTLENHGRRIRVLETV